MRVVIFIQVCVMIAIAILAIPAKEAIITSLFIDTVAIPDATYSIGNQSGIGPEFDAKLATVANELGYPVDWFIAVMKFESNLRPDTVNRYSGAYGLIQFLPSTLVDLGSSLEKVKNSDALYQLDLIRLFYSGTNFKSLTEMRLFTFYPRAVGKADTYNIGGIRTAKQNRIYDLNGDMQITVGEFKMYFDESLN